MEREGAAEKVREGDRENVRKSQRDRYGER